MGPPEKRRRLDRRGGRGRRTASSPGSGGSAEEVAERPAPTPPADGAEAGDARACSRKAHWAIDKVTRDFERGFQFNTAIAAVMELVNDAYRLKDGLYGDAAGGRRRPLRRPPPPPR